MKEEILVTGIGNSIYPQFIDNNMSGVVAQSRLGKIKLKKENWKNEWNLLLVKFVKIMHYIYPQQE